jgi:hypothetical protein
MFRRSVVAFASALALSLGGLLTTAPPASASCGFGGPVDLQSVFSSQTYAGIETRTNIPFVFRYSNAGCLEGMIFTFVGGGGTDVQAMRAEVTSSGVSGDAAVNWVPKPMEYRLLVDVVYRYGGVYGGLSTERWTYPTVLTAGAFRVLPAPSAPSALVLTGEDRTLQVSWGAPSANSSTTTKFIVKYPNGNVLCEVPPNQFSCRATDQADGTYAFLVSAVNQLGQGGEGVSNQVTIGPPARPAFTSIDRVNQGRQLILSWSTSSRTTAVPRVFRVIDQAGREVCGLPVTATQIASGTMSCRVRPEARGSSYTLRVETGLGPADSEPTPALKPRVPKKR